MMVKLKLAGFTQMSQNGQIRVLIVDDHEILRMGLSIFLEACDDMMLVGEAANGQEALALCDQLSPDVVLMDLAMPVMDGMTATTIIANNYPRINVIVLTSTFSSEREQEALDAGAYSYLKKNISIDTLASVIRDAAQ
jgi:two-component system, NarL family, response regulator LiaR